MCKEFVLTEPIESNIHKENRILKTFLTNESGTVETDWAAILAGAGLIIGTVVYSLFIGNDVVDEVTDRMDVQNRYIIPTAIAIDE